MKRLIWLLILCGAGYAVYRYYPELEKLAKQQTGLVDKPAPAADPKSKAPLPSTTPPPKVADKKGPAPVVSGKSAEEAELERRFPLPAFPTLDQAAGNWVNIPSGAFPRETVLKAPVKIPMVNNTGFATLNPGQKVWAVGVKDGQIQVSTRREGGGLEGGAPVDATDFKAVLGTVYDQYKQRLTQRVVAQRDEARKQMQASAASAATAAAAATSGAASTPVISTTSDDAPPALLGKLGPRPDKSLLTDSIKKGQVTDIKMENVKGWGPIRFQEIDGEPYWVGSCQYVAKTIFADFSTEALALVRKGKVEKWVYSGTHEPVP